MAKTRSTPGRVYLSKNKNRPYLAACPADILFAEFFLDLKLQKKVMKLCIHNTGSRAITGMTVYTRYLDKDGRIIGPSEGHIVLNFANTHYRAHATSISSKTVVLPYQDIAGIEAYIGSLTYDNGTTDTFAVEDYILSPVQDLLESRMSARDFEAVRYNFGRRCVFVASSDVPGVENGWLCTCGAVATGTECSSCGMKQKNAMGLCCNDKTNDFIRTLKIRRVIKKSLPYVIASAVMIGGILGVNNYANRYVNIYLPASRLAVTRDFMNEHRYEEALGYSCNKNDRLLYDDILDHAVAYYCSMGQYDRALEFEQCREIPAYEPIYVHAAESYIAGSNEDCITYALTSENEDLRNQVLARLASRKKEAGDLPGACSVALRMTGEDNERYADDLLYELIESLLEESKYEEAVTYIQHLHNTDNIITICNGIETELLRRGKYDDAFIVANITGDTSVFASAYSNATSETLHQYYDKFFPYMTDAEKRTHLANNIAVTENSIAVIRTDGTAVDSVRGVLAENAVSIAAGNNHIVVLLKDGTVRAFGDNTYGQTKCDGTTGIIAIAAAGDHTIVLSASGRARGYGKNTNGQCNVSSWKNVIAIAAGEQHSVALLADATAVACGSNASGQCNLSSYKNIVGIGSGDYASLLIFREGNVIAQGNIMIETIESREWENVIRVSAGNAHLVAVTANGRVLTAGTPPYQGIDSVSSLTRVKYITCGERAVYVIHMDGKISVCGTATPNLSASIRETLQG